MSTWTLVLTLLAYDSGGSAIHSVTGFRTLAECQRAGLVWSKQMTEARQNPPRALATCMEQRKP